MAAAASLWIACFVLGMARGPAEEAAFFLDLCRQGKYDEAAAEFDPKLPKHVDGPQLKKIWESVIVQSGPLKTPPFGKPRLMAYGKITLTRVRCEFTSAPLDALVNVNGEGKVVGLFFDRAGQEGSDKPAADYDDPAKYEEREINVGAKDWPLKGALTLPKGAKPAPLIVLVHGSGPQDRDETIGPNAPFRDLAHGLAGRGVATLRYEKRTHAYRARLAAAEAPAITIDAEVIDDALAALALARTLPGVDPKRIYLLGHSLGGSAAPETARRDGQLAGVILLAALDRQPDVTIVDQMNYIAENDPPQAEASRKAIREFEAAFKRLHAGESGPNEHIMGAPVAYWKSWMALHPAETAAQLKALPFLILRGGRDYQVTTVDYDAFQKALAGRKNVVFHLYPDLNHLFQTGKGKGLPAEYFTRGFMDVRVIDDIAQWVKGGAR